MSVGALAVATAASGCGDGEGPPADSNGAAQTGRGAVVDHRWLEAQRRAERLGIVGDVGDPHGGGPKVAIREVLKDIQSDFPSGAGTMCNEISRAGRRELRRARLSRWEGCQEAIYDLSGQVEDAGLMPWYSEILAVEVTGQRATALVRNADDGPARPVPFVYEKDRGWRLVSLRHAEPVARLLPD